MFTSLSTSRLASRIRDQLVSMVPFVIMMLRTLQKQTFFLLFPGSLKQETSNVQKNVWGPSSHLQCLLE